MINNELKNVIKIVKASGESEPFSEQKLRNSLKKAGASQENIDSIVQDVVSKLHDGMTTKAIYARAFSHLRRKERPIASRYHLRTGLIELGPTGRPFERFVGELLKSEGFDVEVSKIVQGVCVKHEIDVIGTKDDRHIMVECKFHNQLGLRSDVKIALYVQARFEDVERQWKKQPNHGEKFHEVWLVTNTKLTSDATDYASCVGMRALGWNYPAKGSLQELVEHHNLHPLTCLTLLSRFQKQELLREGFILCKDIIDNQNILKKIVGDTVSTSSILQEARELIKPHD